MGHGKGEHDGVGACIKHLLRRYKMNHSTSRLTNSNNVVNWCKQHLSHEFNERMGNVRIFFWNIAMGYVDRSIPYNCTTVLKTRGLHSIRSKKITNIHAIKKRKYSFFFLAFIIKWMFSTHGVFLKRDMEKENMMALGPA